MEESRVDCGGFVLVVVMNPCPCGYYEDPVKPCSCAPSTVRKYHKLSHDRLGEASEAIAGQGGGSARRAAAKSEEGV